MGQCYLFVVRFAAAAESSIPGCFLAAAAQQAGTLRAQRFVGLHLVLYLLYSGVFLHMVSAEVTQVSVLYLEVVDIAQKSVKYLLDAVAALALTGV